MILFYTKRLSEKYFFFTARYSKFCTQKTQSIDNQYQKTLRPLR